MKHNDWAKQYSSQNGSSWPDPQSDGWSFNPPANSSRRSYSPQGTPFLLNPKNAPYINGFKRFSPNGARIGYAIFMLLVAAGTAAIVFLAGRAFVENIALAQAGKQVPAVIVKRYTEDCGDDGTCYHLVAGYAVADKTGKLQNYTRDDSVSEDEYRRYSNAPVKILYLPDNPTVARLVLGEYNTFWPIALNIGSILLALLVGLGFIWGSWKALVKSVRLARYGQMLWGQLEEIKGEEDDGSYSIKVKYSFANPAGYVLTGKASQIRNDLKKEQLPWPATPVVVLYTDDKTYKML
jgi:hypothetical protein